MGIRTAIHEQRLLEFQYDGCRRVVEPHTYGIDRKGHRALRAFQVGGTSRSGSVPDWRIFHEAEMRLVVALEDRFSGPRPEYRRGDKAFQTIEAQL